MSLFASYQPYTISSRNQRSETMGDKPDGLQPERKKLIDNAENPNISVDKGNQQNTCNTKGPEEKTKQEQTASAKNTEETESRDLDTGANDAEKTEESEEKEKEKEQSLGIGDWISLITSCYSLVSYLLDVATDIDLVIDYKQKGIALFE